MISGDFINLTFLDAFSKFDIVGELNLISHKFHYLVYKIWFHISLLFGSKVKFNIRFQSHKSAMNFEDRQLSCNKDMCINFTDRNFKFCRLNALV
ncbi:hypothetical protein UNSW2_41 [Campylobacter concisus UNSW2]|uniref:Uncharacterized protein n=1 Tax=Campylobacter concisus UNSW2 TaxID=1242965 RepID=U2FNX9_9BACT|nr:hypothetical protein UNSW2_41 [Campylobacter concisus UNSW2]